MEKEIITKEVLKWEYFPHLDCRKSKDKSNLNIFEKFNLLCYKWLFPKIDLIFEGFRKVRYFEVVNLKTGKVRLLKADG